MNFGLPGLPKGTIQNLLLWLVPIGVGFEWWDDVVPTGYIQPYGQDIFPSQYPRLYEKWTRGGVHKYGAGSVPGSTKAPDKRGRMSIALDNMGGTAANRVTTGGSGIDGLTLGANGGAETVALTAANHASHRHSLMRVTGYSGAASSNLKIGNTNTVSDWDGSGTGYTTVSEDTNELGTPFVSNQGSGTAHQNMGPGIICNYIIRAG